MSHAALRLILLTGVVACGGHAASPPPSNLAAPHGAPEHEHEHETGASGTPHLVGSTRERVLYFAFEGYPQWAVEHPDLDCPPSLAELATFSTDPSVDDEWHRPLILACGAALPPGVRGIAVSSVGPDGVAGTSDDVHSWE